MLDRTVMIRIWGNEYVIENFLEARSDLQNYELYNLTQMI